MAQKFENEVVILLKAQDLASSKIRKVSNSIRKFNADQAKQTSGADQLANIFKAVGFVEAGLKSATIAASLFKGELEDAETAAKALPFGIGAAFSAGQELGRAIRGINKELERSNALIEQQVRKNKVLEDQAKARKAGITNLKSINDQLRLAQASDFDRQRIQLEIETQARLDKVRETALKDRSEFSENFQRAQFRKIRELEAIELKKINFAQSIARGEAGKAIIKERADAAAMAAREAETLRRDELSNQQALEQAKSDTRRLALEAQGRDLEAQEEMIRQGFKVQIQAAQEAGRKFVVIELEKQRKLALLEAQRAAAQDAAGDERVEGTATQTRQQQSRFLTGAAEAATQFGGPEPIVVEAKKSNTLLELVNKHLAELSKQLTKNPPLIIARGTASGA